MPEVGVLRKDEWYEKKGPPKKRTIRYYSRNNSFGFGCRGKESGIGGRGSCRVVLNYDVVKVKKGLIRGSNNVAKDDGMNPFA